MNTLLTLIGNEMKKAFASCGYDEKFAQATVSNRPDLCQFQCNGAMAAAKEYHKAPIMIANDVVAKVDKAMFSKVEAVAPGFINMDLAPAFLTGYLEEMLLRGVYGYEKPEKQRVTVIDYGGANVAKPLHIGHLRPAVIGESIKRIYKFAGDKVIGDVHLGDWGLQIGQIIEELRDRKPELCYFDESYKGEYPKEAPFDISELEDIYPTASKKSKTDPEFAKRAHEATVKLQENYPPFRAIWQHIINVSVKDLKKNYDNLNVNFDLWLGESDAEPFIADMIDKMVKDGFAYESQGALVVDIAEEGDSKEYPPCIVRKSDGAAIYQTTDLATIIQRERDFKPDKYVYVADKRQDLHFLQVFRTAKKCGLVNEDKDLLFVGFGTVNGKDGKPFKTRDGGVMRLEYLITEINDEVYKKVMSGREMSEENARKIAKTVGLAALKYADLSNQAAKDYIFDIDRFTSFEGNTGPYILYTMVRIKSILAKYKENGGKDTKELKLKREDGSTREYKPSEISLMLNAARFNETVEKAYQETAPHKICQYIYDMSNAFNSFYHENRIMGEEDLVKQGEWIKLIETILHILEECIDMLGFEAPEQM
ncbi:MAG: arginine--tRNA ligase [Lachnospiraceae bacterium]|nr:arginine--tRNA ligase [Lachnospiraceae bacterium]